MNQKEHHTFHIPVMGIGFTIDTPVKVAHFGISSAISMVDDILIEKMREFYCEKLDIPFQEISTKIEDFRAKRITAYLNLIDKIVKDKFEDLKNSVHKTGTELGKYYDMLPDSSAIKLKFNQFIEKNNVRDAMNWLKKNLQVGSIDVNIMTKLDKENYIKNEKLSQEHNDAHAALRGFANSELQSSLVLSAGLNPRLYSYIEEFDDFYPQESGELKKRIILKVSDYRSAFIQGKLFAKKGIWISEYRIESGLNCGGHAFATQGYLMGPILEEFKLNREILIQSTHELLVKALKDKKRYCPEKPLELKFSAQGGVGTAEEHQFLLEHYELDSVGWATPFLLVPEVTNVDEYTLEILKNATEDDLYLSNSSPLGVLFNTVKGNTKDIEREEFIRQGTPGSPCTKQYAAIFNEFTDRSICHASRKYQKHKIEELQALNLDAKQYQKEYNKVVEKSCICVGLGTSALLVNNLDHSLEGDSVSICPGPNLAYFSEIATLNEMVDHIYGRTNLIQRTDRNNMFINELKMYVDYLKKQIEDTAQPISDKQKEYLLVFKKKLHEGIAYYKNLFTNAKARFEDMKANILNDLDSYDHKLNLLFANE